MPFSDADGQSRKVSETRFKKRVSCTSAKNIAGVTPGPDTAQGPSMKSKNETDKRQAKGDKNIHFITTSIYCKITSF